MFAPEPGRELPGSCDVTDQPRGREERRIDRGARREEGRDGGRPQPEAAESSLANDRERDLLMADDAPVG